jgi:TolB-like protein
MQHRDRSFGRSRNSESNLRSLLKSDFVQDEILTRLSKIADLKVISRTSPQHYKSAPEKPA